MSFKAFLRTLLEGCGLAESPAPPPQAADVFLADSEQWRPIFARLAVWGATRIHLIIGDEAEGADFVEAVHEAAQTGMEVGVRGMASVLGRGTLLAELAAAGASEIEFPLVSAIGEVHDALCGGGDYRCAQAAIDALAGRKIKYAAQVILTQSTWKTLERTLDLLADRATPEVRFFAVASRNDEPSNWAISAGELLSIARWIEESNRGRFTFTWYPPLKFDPARTLSQQVRRGPRAMADTVRIEPDGRVIPPTGPAVPGGNVLQEDWRSIARHEAFRAWKRRATAPPCAECPGLSACDAGCLQNVENWAEG